MHNIVVYMQNSIFWLATENTYLHWWWDLAH